MAAFEAAIAIGAGIECDVRRSAVGAGVGFHDERLERLCGTSGRVEREHSSTLARLRLQDSEHGICRLTDLLDLVSGRVPLLIEAKVRRNGARIAALIAADLEAYDDQVGVMSFDPRVPHWLFANAPNIRRGLVVADSLSAPRRWIAMRHARAQFLAVDRLAIARPWVERARNAMPVYCWTVRDKPERSLAGSYADALIWEADGRP